jgi:hypothetical protein
MVHGHLKIKKYGFSLKQEFINTATDKDCIMYIYKNTDAYNLLTQVVQSKAHCRITMKNSH